ncbi:hypothetical protein Taro_001182 [Colocasia esculenta]|uniref:Uncharacterized protein n=1 Tax=Colocasia esculenta TaxID=4460 RepID=A0A843TF48_COLES|nr:hypothetical protein [Colocasia esculenta]
MACVCWCAAVCSALVVGGRTPVVDIGPQLVLFQCLTLGFSAGAPKGVSLGPAECVTCRLWWLVRLHYSWFIMEQQLDLPSVTARLRELEMEKNSEVKRAQLGVVPGWVTFLGSLPTDTVVGPVCWLGRHKWYQSLTQPEVQELSATQGKVLRYGSHLLKP